MELFDLQEVLENASSKYNFDEMKTIIDRNPQFGEVKENQYVVTEYFKNLILSSNDDYLLRTYVDGITELDLTDIKITGDILDIGAGGEGIIAQLFPTQVIGIAPKEHLKGLMNAPECKYKISMDARDLQFIDESFMTITSFFTLMYIDYNDHKKVFSEIYRVLRKGGKFYLWDLLLPDNKNNYERYLRYFNFLLPEKTVKTGYGTKWLKRTHTLELFAKHAEEVGFKINKIEGKNRIIHMILEK